MKRYKAIAVFMILLILFLDVRVFFLSYFKQGAVAKNNKAGVEIYGSDRGIIFDRNMKKMVETENEIITSAENQSYQFKLPKRYAEHQICPHFIGYTDYASNGVSGIEKDYNLFLKAIPNHITLKTYRDAAGRILKGKGTVMDTDSVCQNSGIRLSIEAGLQALCEQEGKTLGKGAIAVMNAHSGEIEASASFPKYEPNQIERYLNDENKALVNRCTSNYNVGSIFKVIVCMAALESGIKPSFSYSCTGAINCGGVVFHCHKLDGHGTLDMKRALAFSCNTYFIQLAQKVGGKKILDMCRKLHLHQSDVLSESISIPAATLPTENELVSPAALANFSFGQGTLSFSPLKAAQVYSVVANGGFLPSIKLVLSKVMQGEEEVIGTGSAKRILSAKNANLIQSFLIYTVKNGTGKNAFINSILCGGKTATAQTGKYLNGKEKLISYFVGFVRINGDDYVILVLKENGVSGSVDCAPVFKRIAKKMKRN